MSKLIDYIVLIGLTLLITVTPYPHGSIYLRHSLLIGIIIFSLSILRILFSSNMRLSVYDICARPVRNLISNGAHLCKPLFLIVALSFLSIFYSVYKYASIISFLKLISYVALFFLVINTVTTNKRFYYLLWVIFLTVSFYALYGILQYRGLIEKNYWAEPHSLSSRFINSNHFVDYLAMSILPMFAFLISKRAFFLKLSILPLLGISSLSLIYTKSRFGWLSIFIAFILLIILLLKYSGLSRKRVILMLIILVSVLWFLVSVFGKEVVFGRLSVISSTGYQSLIQRLQIWWGTFKAIMHYPWGTGLGIFEYIYPQFRIHSDRFKVDYAHNDYLQICLEIGVLGLGLVIWLIARYLKLVLVYFKSSFDYKNAGLNISLLASIFVMLIHSLVDFSLHIPANSIIFIIFAALLWGNLRESAPDSRQGGSSQANLANGGLDLRKSALKKLFVSISLIIIILSCFIYISDLHFRRGETAYKNFKWNEAISAYKKAIKFMPLNAMYYERLGTIYAKRAGLKLKESQWDSLAEINFKTSLRLNLRNSEAHLSLARVYKKLALRQLALQEFRNAAKSYPSDGAYHLFLADYLLENNLVDEAIREYKKYFSLFTVEERYRYPLQIFAACFQKTRDYDKLQKLIPDLNNRREILLSADSYAQSLRLSVSAMQESALKEISSRITNLHLEFAQFLADNSEWRGVKEEFAKVKQLAYNNIGLRLQIASTYERHNKIDRAILEYQEVLNITPDNRVAKEALNRLRNKER